ncbi:MAG TPA: DUF4097 family beta strand repeat-containing protein [Acidisoma sp.]|nr:DUF4097 family beta strand repeat-containing protein [Acidisoma sp.]
MSEETLIILRMVREGKISPEQGADLLRAVESAEGRAGGPTPPTPPTPGNGGSVSADAISEVQTRLGDLQAKLGEVQARLGAAQANSSGSSSGFSFSTGSFPFGLGDLNIGRMIEDAMRGVSSIKTEAVRMAKQAAREAQREARKIRHEARRSGRPFRFEFNVDFDDSDRPKNDSGLEEEKTTATNEAEIVAGKPLRIMNPFGSVRVLGSAEDGKAHVEESRTVWAQTEAEREDAFSSLQVTISADESGTLILCDSDEETENAILDLSVTVPSGTPVEIETTFGNIHCEDLTAGAPKIESLSGNVELFHMKGDDANAMSVRTRSGDIALRQWQGGETKLESVSGGLRVDGLKAPRAQARSRSGDITLANIDIGVDVSAESASGGIEVRGGQCGQALSLRSQSADINLSNLRAGRIQTETISGDQEISQVTATNGPMILKSVSGDIQASESQADETTLNTVSGDGSFSFAAPFEGSLTAGSVSGDVDVRLWSNSSVKVELISQSGSMRCDLPLEERTGDASKRISGRLGAGTGSVKMQSVSGDLQIRSVQ